MPVPVTLRRLGYRAAHRLLRVAWMVGNPSLIGVKCLLTHDNRILLVRHTYGNRAWDLPGGGVKRGEDPLAAARRETSEELGVEPETWRELGHLRGFIYHRPETVHCFGATLTSPTVAIDAGELAAARWFDRTALPPGLGPYMRAIAASAAIPSGD